VKSLDDTNLTISVYTQVRYYCWDSKTEQVTMGQG